jgi:hypothetical protein
VIETEKGCFDEAEVQEVASVLREEFGFNHDDLRRYLKNTRGIDIDCLNF